MSNAHLAINLAGVGRSFGDVRASAGVIALVVLRLGTRAVSRTRLGERL